MLASSGEEQMCLLSYVYSKSKPTGQYEKVASAGGQIYVSLYLLRQHLNERQAN
jgi:hypothetical protein